MTPHLWTGSGERRSHHMSGRPLADSPTSASSLLATSRSAIPPVSVSVASNINGHSNRGGRSRHSSRPSLSRSFAAHAVQTLHQDRLLGLSLARRFTHKDSVDPGIRSHGSY